VENKQIQKDEIIDNKASEG